MSTISDVQNAIVNIITPAIYPLGNSQPSIAGGRISAITPLTGGTLYTTPILTITGGGGSGALAHAVVTDGVITSIVIDAQGSGYTSSPTITVTGTGSGATFSSTINSLNVYIAAGDFLKRNLDDELALGNAFVSVFAINGMTRNTTRLRAIYSTPVITTATITLTVEDNTVTIGGTVTPEQASMIIVNDVGYSYAAIAGDTLSTIAAALVLLIPNSSAVGAVITITGAYSIVARVSVPGTARQILHSEEGMFRVRVITASHQIRETIGNAVQLAVAEHVDMNGNRYYMDMPDLISASIRPNKVSEVNTYELASAFARDYIYLVEYHVVQVTQFQTIADAFTTSSISTN